MELLLKKTQLVLELGFQLVLSCLEGKASKEEEAGLSHCALPGLGGGALLINILESLPGHQRTLSTTLHLPDPSWKKTVQGPWGGGWE